MKRRKLDFLTVRKILHEKKISIFTPRIFGQLFSVSPERVKYFLETYTKKGLFLRLKKGLYILEDKTLTDEEIANALYKPSYISFEYALAKYGIIPEMVYAITSTTTKPTRNFSVSNIRFSYYSIKKPAFTGYSLRIEQAGGRNARIFFAEPEKALVDYLYFVALGRKSFNDRLDVRKLNKVRIIHYVKLFQSKKLLALVKKLYD